jgi:hypothetical protein
MDDEEFELDFEQGSGARELVHFQTPFTHQVGQADTSAAERAQLLILEYLARFGTYLGVTKEHVEFLRNSRNKSVASDGSGVQFRWGASQPLLVREGESIVWWLQQSHFLDAVSWDVWDAGVRIVVHDTPLRIVGATSTAFDVELDPARVNDAKVLRSQPKDIVARALGLQPEILNDVDPDFVIYRFDSRDQRDAISQKLLVQVASDSTPTNDEPLADGTVVPVIAAQFSLLNLYGEPMTYRALVGVDGVHYLKALAATVTGGVFRSDPRTSNGRAASGPNDYSDQLDVYQTQEPILRLFPPRSGRQWLEGQNVEVRGEPGGQPGPSVPSGVNFYYKSRTNQFAAVNAYYHCDAKFELVRAFGFSLASLFPANFGPSGTGPVMVWSRATIAPGCGDGRCINAQVVQGAASRSIGQIRFALADLSDFNAPLGLAVDDRFAWHEFCHALLVGATNNLEFRFAHSAGDAMAAIACDPDSKLVYENGWRGVTYPWVEGPMRRHDRDVGDGWGWFGQMYDPAAYPSPSDPAGYRAEQILSTTLFSVYRSAGGDAETGPKTADISRRREVSNYILYLIVRAISALATSAVPTRTPAIFANRLMEADIGTSVFAYAGASRPGGTLYKVIRWAFEQQGLYQAPAATWPQNSKGRPPRRDVYIDDGRQGEYQFTRNWRSQPQCLWLRDAADGQQGSQGPALNKTSFVYVRVSNRGLLDAPATNVQVYENAGAQLDIWSKPGLAGSTWKKLHLHPGGAAAANIPAGGSGVLGPFEWQPVVSGRAGLLVATSTKGDVASIDTAGLACATGPVSIVDLVPNDNNLGFQEWTV